MSVASRIAWRELRSGLSDGLRGFRIFLACLALGVAAIAAVGSVRTAITEGLKAEGAALLGGDAEVQFTYRFAREEERAWMDSVAERVSETVDFRSMAVVERETVERGLTQVKAVDDLYPLIGSVTLAPPIPLDAAFSGADGLPGGVMERVLAERLALRPGDPFMLGDQRFVLTAILDRYPDNSGGGFGLGPRTMVRTADLAQSGLIQEGTLFDTAYRLDLAADTDLGALEAEAAALYRDSGLRWRDARAGAPGVTEFVDRLGAFLILVGLSGLAVGGVGVSAAVRSYLATKTEVIATLKTLGAARATIFQVYFLQVGALTLFGLALGLLLGAVGPLIAAPLIEARLPIPAAFAIYPAPLFEAALYGLLAALLFTLWPLARAEEVKAATLFRDALGAGRIVPALRYVVATLIILAALIGAAAWFSETLFLTLWTAGGLAGALVLLMLSAALARVLSRRSGRAARGRPALRAALGSIGGRGGEATSVVLSLGLGLTVLAAVGQIDGNLRAAISRDLPEVAPSYFFVDIQPDQIEGFRTRLADDAQVSRVDSAPMLRGIITRVNGLPAEEVVGDHWVIQGDRGVTYSAEIPDNTEVTEGEWWPADYSGPPLVSFADEEAREMGLQIGDEITVNILGRDISARIASFRAVSFENAGIGFILSMNPGALAGAPHSWISTVYAEPEAEAQILRDLASTYPNITAIRVRDAIDRVVEVVDGIAAATRYGAAVTLVTGFLVLIGAAAAGERHRIYESAVMKTLGATRGRILQSFALRSALLGLAAGIVALIGGALGGWAVSRFIMDTQFELIWSNALAIIGAGIGATLLAGLMFALRPLAARPARVLRARD